MLEAIQPPGWQRAPGFSWGMAASGGRTVAVAGQLATTGGAIHVEPGLSFARQFAMCLENVVTVVRAAGGKPEDVAQLRGYVRDMDAFRNDDGAIRDAWRATLGKHFPAMTLVEISQLFDPNALVEIDALAIINTEE